MRLHASWEHHMADPMHGSFEARCQHVPVTCLSHDDTLIRWYGKARLLATSTTLDGFFEARC